MCMPGLAVEGLSALHHCKERASVLPSSLPGALTARPVLPPARRGWRARHASERGLGLLLQGHLGSWGVLSKINGSLASLM